MVKYDDQSKAYINYIANNSPHNATAATGGLFYITLADTKIDDKILEEATKRNVPVYQGFVDINEYGDVRVGHFKLLNSEELNVSAQTLLPDIFKKEMLEKAAEIFKSNEKDNLETRLETATNNKIKSLKLKRDHD